MFVTYPSPTNAQIAAAKRRAKETGVPYMLAIMDDCDERRVCVCRYEYAFEDEFIAFDGEVIIVVHPDGEIDH